MFGRHFKSLDHSAYIGWRAIFHPQARNPVDILPDRGSQTGDEELVDEIIAWLNKKNEKLGKKSPWKWMVAQSKSLTTSDGDYIQFIDGDFILEACPQRSYGYLYIGAAKVSDWHDFEPGVEAGITQFDRSGKRVDRVGDLNKVSV